MPWWEISVGFVTLLTVRRLLRWRRSGHDGRNSRHSSRSSQRIGLKSNLLADSDPSRIAHDGRCEHCGAQVVVPMSRTRLERRPWRIVWWCQVCGRQSRAMVPSKLVPVFASWDKAGGMGLSMREVSDMVGVSLAEFERAVDEELR